MQSRVEQLEARSQPTPAVPAALPAVAPLAAGGATATPDPLGGTTLSFMIDNYYSYNFNAPIGRTNLLRAYDVSSNAFSLSQTVVLLENAPDPAHGKRWGARLDLQFGQATATPAG